MNAHFHCDLPVEAGLASRKFVAREFPLSASLIRRLNCDPSTTPSATIS